jgi:leader peptidase (prepilin peptidase)/N-methyltransferase
MGIDAIFDSKNWAEVPFPFWSAVFFVFGSIVGSFLNVCIYRMPLGLSVVTPPSHCPHCKYSIPWFLNIPLVTWLWLRGKCAQCRAAISPRYFLVELLTGLMFMACWLMYGPSAWLALMYCLFVAGLLVGTFTDFEHLIIPDEITLGGMVVGILCSLAVPALHDTRSHLVAVGSSVLGLGVGWGIMFAIMRGGKLLFGRHRIKLDGPTQIVFGESALKLPDREIPYEEILGSKTDTIQIEAQRVELVDRGYCAGPVRLSAEKLEVGNDTFDPETVPHMEVVATSLVLPRDAMGFGDVKLMGAIGAFLGWQSTLFTLGAGALIGSLISVTLILVGRKDWATRIPLVPYLSLGALLWVFGGKSAVATWFQSLSPP